MQHSIPNGPRPALRSLFRGAPTAFSLCLVAALQLGTPARAWPGTDSQDDRAKADIEFARGLAADWQFIDLAEQLLTELERSGAGASLSEELGLVRCDVYAAGARRESDEAIRNDLFEKSLESYRDFIDKHPLSELLPDAQRGYVDLTNVYTRDLARQLEESIGPEAVALRERIAAMLEPALALVGDLIDGLEATPNASESEKRALWAYKLIRGQLLLQMADAADDGTFFYGRAEQTLEDLAMSAEGTWPGMRAYLELGKVYLAQGSFDEAATYFEYVVDQMIPRDPAKLEGLRKEIQDGLRTQAEYDNMFVMASLGLPGLVESFLNAGDVESACNWGLHYHNVWKYDGFSLPRPDGYRAILGVASALLDSGGYVGGTPNAGNLAWFEDVDARNTAFPASRNQRTALDLAISIAQGVIRDNSQSFLAVQAGILLSEAVNRPGVVVDPEVLFEAALGEYNSSNLVAAIEGMKRILARLDAEDDARRREFAPQVLYHIGMSFGKLDREFEASMAFREAILRYEGDPIYDIRNAKKWYDTMNGIKRRTKDDPAVEAIWRASEAKYLEMVRKYPEGGSAADAITFQQGIRLYNQGEFEAARTKFQEIERGQDYWEKASVYAALCLYKLGQFDRAMDEFTHYLEVVVPDPNNEPPADSNKALFRREARAMATFYSGQILVKRQDWRAVVQRLAGFYDEFPEQSSYGPTALFTAGLANLQMGAFDAAEALLRTMIEHYPDHERTGLLAMKIFQALRAREDPALVPKMAEMLHLANQLDPDPDFGNLRTESKLWVELGEWSKAEKLLSALAEDYAGDEERAEILNKHVLPDLGEVLLAEGDVHRALEVLSPLIPDPEETNPTLRPSASTVTNWCRAAAGWVSGEGREIEVHPGVGGAENIERAAAWLAKLLGTVEKKWTCEWYRLKFDMAFIYYQWSQVDDARRQDVRSQIQFLQNNLGSRFEGIDGVAGMTETCGKDETYTRRFLWLWDQVK